MTIYPEVRVLKVSKPSQGMRLPLPLSIYNTNVPKHYPAHRHEFLEFFLITEGTGYQIINGKSYRLQPGTCAFLLPYQIHELITTSTEPLRMYLILFGQDLLYSSSAYEEGLEKLIMDSEELPPSLLIEEHQDYVIEIMNRMLHEYRQQHPWRNHVLRYNLLELIIFFNRLQLENKLSSSNKSDYNSNSIWPIIQYIHLHFREPLSLSQLAQTFDMNPTYLSGEFKKQIGSNFVHFLQEVRIRHASALLASTDLSGIEIAIEVGFASFRSFSRVFRQWKGVTPKQYRNENQLRHGTKINRPG